MPFYARVAKIMGEEFALHLQRIIPSLLEDVSSQGCTLVPMSDPDPSDPDPSASQRLLRFDFHVRGQADFVINH